MEKEKTSKMNGRNLLATLTVVLLSLLTWQLRWVILILFGSIVLGIALDVLIKRIQQYFSLPRSISLFIVVSLILILGAIFVQLLVPELINQARELGNLAPTLITKLKSIIVSQTDLLDSQQKLLEQFSWDSLQPVGSRILGFAGGAANIVIQVILVSLIGLLLTLDPKAHRKIIIACTPRTFRNEVNDLLNECRAALGGWLTGMTISAISVFVMTWGSLLLLKVPLALLSALLCGILTFVPTIGPSLATLIPLGVSLLISPSLMFQVLIVRLVIQNLEAFIITPLLLSRTVKLLPTIALLSQLSLGTLLGLPGVLLALPLAVVIQVCMQKIVVRKVMDVWV